MIIQQRFRIMASLFYLAAAAVWPAAQELTDHGFLAIYKQGKPVGREEFTISISSGAGTLESKSSFQATVQNQPQEINLNSKLQLDPGFVPKSYELQVKTGGNQSSLKVGFKPNLANCEFLLGTQQRMEAAILPQTYSVVDNNVFVHWAMVLLQAGRNRRPQNVNVFIPQDGSTGVGPLVLEYLGRESVIVGNRNLDLHHYRASSTDLKVDLWEKDPGVIWKIQVAQSDAEVVRVQ